MLASARTANCGIPQVTSDTTRVGTVLRLVVVAFLVVVVVFVFFCNVVVLVRVVTFAMN